MILNPVGTIACSDPSMNSEAEVAALTAQQRLLLEALPCYVFVQRGSTIVYANRVARDILHLAEGAVMPVEDLFRGQYPGFAYAQPARTQRGPGNVFGSGALAYSSDFICQMRTPLDSAVPVRGQLSHAARGTGTGAADCCLAHAAQCRAAPTQAFRRSGRVAVQFSGTVVELRARSHHDHARLQDSAHQPRV